MATVYFVRGGVNSAQRQGVREVPDALLQKLNHSTLVFSEEPPMINPEEHISDVAAWQHVVIQILPNQCSNGMFPTAGYYYVKEMSPMQFCEHLGIASVASMQRSAIQATSITTREPVATAACH